ARGPGCGRRAPARGLGGVWRAAPGALQTCLAIRERLAGAAPDDPFRQSQVAITYTRLVSAYKMMNNVDEMRKAIDAGRAIALRLVTAFPNVKLYKDELAWFDRELAALKT